MMKYASFIHSTSVRKIIQKVTIILPEQYRPKIIYNFISIRLLEHHYSIVLLPIKNSEIEFAIDY